MDNFRNFFEAVLSRLKGTHREKAPSNKTPALTKSISMDICVVGALDHLFRRHSSTETSFQTGETPFFVISPFCIPHSIYRNISF